MKIYQQVKELLTLDWQVLIYEMQTHLREMKQGTKKNQRRTLLLSDINLQDVSLCFEADEEISSKVSVKKKFDNMEFLNEFQKV